MPIVEGLPPPLPYPFHYFLNLKVVPFLGIFKIWHIKQSKTFKNASLKEGGGVFLKLRHIRRIKRH